MRHISWGMRASMRGLVGDRPPALPPSSSCSRRNDAPGDLARLALIGRWVRWDGSAPNLALH